MKNRFDSIDNKLDKIVSFYNISANSHTAPTRPVPVNIPTNPLNISLIHRTNVLHSSTVNSPSQINTGCSNPFPKSIQQRTPLTSSTSSTLQQQQQESNTVDRTEFASAMGQVNQLHNKFGNLSSQLAQITKFLSGSANTQ